MTIFAAVMLWFMANNAPTGQLYIRTAPGLTVLVDGIEYGTTTTRASGIVIDVPEGRRVITLRSPEGAESKFEKDVIAAQFNQLDVSAMSLRSTGQRRANNPGAIRVAGITEDCEVFLNNKLHDENRARPDQLVLDNLTAGSHNVAVHCGTVTRATPVNVHSGMMALLRFDAASRALVDDGERPRVVNMTPKDTGSFILDADVPAEWKHALSAAVKPPCVVKTAQVSDLWTVRMLVMAPTWREFQLFVRRLESQWAVQKVTWPETGGYDRSGQVTAVVTVRFQNPRQVR